MQFPPTPLPRTLGVILSAALAACGGGGGNETPSASALVTPVSDAASATVTAVAEAASIPSSAASSADASAPGASAAGALSPAIGASALLKATTAASSGINAATGSALTAGPTPTGVSVTASGAGSGASTGAIAIASAAGNIATAPLASGTGSAVTVKAAATTSTTDAPADVRIYVEPNGSDAATGDTQTIGAYNGPVLTLSRAQQLARAKLAAMQAGAAPRAPVRVLIGPGTYALSTTQIFNVADSGTATAPMSYEARQGGTVTISGGVSLGSKTAPSTATSLSFSAPNDNTLTNGGAQLYVNDRRAILARQPNAGSAWFVQKAVPLGSDAAGSEGAEAFAPAAADLKWLAGLSASDKGRAIVDMMHSWTSSRHHLSAIGTPTGAVRVTPKSLWPFMAFGVSQRYVVENVVAALDAPGEWIYENGAIRYIRQTDEAGKTVTPVLPVLEKLVLVQGDSASKPVQNLQFIGLAFAHTRYVTPAAGYIDHQSATDLGAAVEVNKASGVVFERCQFTHTGTWGLWLRDGVRNSKVTNSTFTDTGAGGIRVGLTSQNPADTSATGANQINGNSVSETGKLFPGASAVWLGQTWDNQVQWNTIFRTTYTGISVGWAWGYTDATSGRNKIHGNLLYNIGQGQLADLGAIYTLGKSPGTTITSNVIREVRGYAANGGGAWGIYNDQGSSGIVMQTNIVVGTDHGGYFLQYGRDNVLHNNVFAASDAPDINIGRLDVATNLKVRANLFISNKAQIWGANTKTAEVIKEINEVFSSLSATVDNTICGAGCTTSKTTITTTSAPLSISTNSTTWVPIINSALNAKASTSAQAMLAAPAPALVPVIGKELLPPTPVATGLDWSIDIAGTAVGTRPSTGFSYVLGSDPNSMKVIDKADAPGGKCLAFYDSAKNTNSYEPMAYATLNHTKGTTTVEFSLQIDAATSFWHEWRDNGSPFLGGPTMFVSAKGVQVHGVTVASVDVGQWIKFKVSAPMGQTNATWKLEMTRANGDKVNLSGLAMKHANFSRLNWLGFISNGVTASTSCVADLKASNL